MIRSLKRACHRQLRMIAVVTTLTAVSMDGIALAASKVFTGATSTDWNTDSNWNPTGVPTSADTVTLGNKTADLSTADATVNSFTQSGGTLTGSATLTVTGPLTWSSGTMSGTGRTNANGGLTISGTGAKTLNRTLANAAAAVWTDAGNVTIGTGGTFNNQSGATFTAQNDQTILSGGGSPHFANAGTFTKAIGTLTTVNVAFDNSGSVIVQSGTLKLSGGGNSSGSFDCTAGTLQFSGGTHNLASAASLVGGGVIFSAGTVNDAGSYDVQGSTAVSGATANFTGTVNHAGPLTISSGTANLSNSGGTLSVPGLALSGGTLSGSSVVTVTGMTSWSGGSMSGTGQTIAVAGLAVSGSVTKSLTRTLSNAGAATWTDTGNISIGTNGIFSNQSRATFTVQNDQVILNGGGSPHFDNAGAFTKTIGALTAVNGGVAFNNSGSVTASSGTINLAGGGTSTGNFDCTGGGIQFGGGTHNLTAAATIGGSGTVAFSAGTVNHPGKYNVTGGTTVSGGTANLTGSVTHTGALSVSSGTANISNTEGTLTVATLTESGGTLSGSSVITVESALNWSAGSMSGSGQTIANGGMSLNGTSTKSLTRTLMNAAAATWSDTGNLSIGTGGVFDNHGGATFTVQNDQSILNGGGSPHFDNAGAFTKTIGALTTVNGGVAFNNSGRVVVQSGTINFSGGGTSTGSFDCTGATLQFGGGSHTLTASAGIVGGSVVFSGGTVNHAGSYDVSGSTTVSGGTANFTGSVTNTGPFTISSGTATISNAAGTLNLPALTFSNGTLSGTSVVHVAGSLNWSGGAMGGTGRTLAAGGLSLNGTGTKTLSRRLSNSSNATWTGTGDIFMGSGGVLENQVGATFSVQNDQNIFWTDGSPHIDNAGTFIKEIGGGTTQISASLPFNNSGTVDLRTGTLSCGGGYLQSGGTTGLNGGALASVPNANIQGGSLQGSGTITGDVLNAAELKPGPGVLNISGAYTQLPTGTFAEEISGVSAVQFGQLAASGTVTLDGTLSVTLTKGFVPTLGNTFQVLSFASLAGGFATTSGLSIANGQGLQEDVGASAITLVVVPQSALTPTATATATSPPTPPATSTPNPTPSVQPTGGCAGDCGGDGVVTVDELLTMVNMALGNAPVTDCEAGDVNRDQQITVDEILLAVNNALNGCELPATPTPGTISIEPIGGGAPLLVTGLSGISSLVTALAGGFEFGAAAVANAPTGSLQSTNGGGAGACPLGGSAVRTCTPLGLGAVTLSFDLSGCTVDTPEGSVTADGTVILQGTGFCPTAVLPPVTVLVDVHATLKDGTGATIAVQNANLNGTGSPSLGGTCSINGLAATLTGSIESFVPAGTSVTLTLEGTSVTVGVTTFNGQCVPVVYSLTLDGAATLSDSLSPRSFSVTFVHFLVNTDASSFPTRVDMNGDISSGCFGGTATFSTITSLSMPNLLLCPTGGALVVSSTGGAAEIFYHSDGSVGIDLTNDGSIDESFPSCRHPVLLACVL